MEIWERHVDDAYLEFPTRVRDRYGLKTKIPCECVIKNLDPKTNEPLKCLSMARFYVKSSGVWLCGVHVRPLKTKPGPVIECAVCMQDIPSVKQRTLRCKHIFCTQCINKWQDNGNNTCPLCRSAICPTAFPPHASMLSEATLIW